LLYGTGFGPTAPASPADILVVGAPPLVDAQRLTLRIGGVPATVEFAGLVSSGLYQFNVVVPNVGQGDQALSAEVNGVRTPDNVFVAVAP